MRRRAGGGLVLALLLAGCQSTERAALKPLPEDDRPISYQELLLRARAQASAAQEFFFRDSWVEVEQVADSLQQTAARMTRLKPEDVPAKHRDSLNQQIDDLTKAAVQLHTAAKTKDVQKTNEAMQLVNLKVRDLRGD